MKRQQEELAWHFGRKQWFLKVPDFEKFFFLYAVPRNYHLCFLPAETLPKPPDLLVCKAKPSQMNILGLENVSFSFGGLSHGHIAVCHFPALRVLRQEGSSWQLGERGPSALCSSVTELIWIQLVLRRGLTISYTVKLTINQPSQLPGTSMIPVCLYFGKKFPSGKH